MIKAILSLALIASAFALTDSQYAATFLDFAKTYGKSYHHDEFQYRLGVFRANYDFIVAKNAAQSHMTLAINEFADLTHAEFIQQYAGLKHVTIDETQSVVDEKTVAALPTSWDWNTKGAVTPIKNQEQCGSCWSFSTTGSTEGCHFINSNSLTGLSEQNLMDCSDSYGNAGCDGGLMTDAMNYVIANGGIDTESSYPYTAEDGTSCNYVSANSGATLKAYVNVMQGNETDLQDKVSVGPTSVAIDASQNSFQFYSSGVYYEPACSSTSLDHGVLAVGWGVLSGSNPPNYWIVKNSWGTSWGQAGYIWMARNMNNNCGIATMATLPQC
jgi:cathepsin L